MAKGSGSGRGVEKAAGARRARRKRGTATIVFLSSVSAALLLTSSQSPTTSSEVSLKPCCDTKALTSQCLRKGAAEGGGPCRHQGDELSKLFQRPWQLSTPLSSLDHEYGRPGVVLFNYQVDVALL